LRTTCCVLLPQKQNEQKNKKEKVNKKNGKIKKQTIEKNMDLSICGLVEKLELFRDVRALFFLSWHEVVDLTHRFYQLW